MTRAARTMQLGDVIRFGNGKAIKPGGEGRYSVYGSNGIIGGCDDFRYENGVIIGRVGAYCGSVMYCPQKFWASDNTLVVFPASDQFDTKFLFYLLTDARLSRYAGGAAQPLVTQTVLRQVKVRVPPLSVQRRLAGILSAYDEFIENSQRRIRILEEMARALYREWFVHFRFPGHDKVPRVASPLGDIPRGWEVLKLSILCDRMESGGTPKRKVTEYWEGGDIDWFKTGELWDGFLFDSEEKITKRGQRESTARLFDPGTILMAIYGSPTVGRLGIVTQPSSCNQAALGLLANTEYISQTFLYFVLLSLRGHFNGLAQGAAQQNISKEKVAETAALVPPRTSVAAFDKLADPIFSQVQTLQQRIRNLRRTRDLLLPRLLSGQIPLEVAPDEDTAFNMAPARSESGFQPEEGALRVAEESPAYHPANGAHAGQNDDYNGSGTAPTPIDQIDRTEVLQVIRQVFGKGPPRERDGAIHGVARALGYRRTGARIQEILHTDLLTAVRRGILENTDGELRLLTRSITDYERDFLKQQFLAAIDRAWIDRDDAIRDFCRWLGFARTGPVIEDTARSLINDLLREGRLGADSANLIRRA